MKRILNLNLYSLILPVLFFLCMTQAADAVGTSSGTAVDNSAVVDYQVGGIGQPQTGRDGCRSWQRGRF